MRTASIPKLFVWGRNGLPGEFYEHICKADSQAKIERGGKPYRGVTKFYSDGVEYFAEHLLSELRRRRLRDSGRKISKNENKAARLKISDELASWIYLLHAYCFEWGQPATPKLLHLTFEALGLREGKPATGVEDVLGLAIGIKNMAAFLDAAELDGEADARGNPMTVSALAKVVGMSRKRIGVWREMPAYKSRRQFCQYAACSPGSAREKP